MNYDNEIWKDIVIEKNGVVYDYEGLYQVSNLGRVRSLDRIDNNGYRRKGKIIKCRLHKSGYMCVGLRKNGEKQQSFSIHRLVATAFIPNPNNLPVVNHRDECKTNNYVKNLEWCTHKYNTNYGTCQEKRSEKQKGKPLLEETKQKISEANKDKYTGGKNPRARKVICLETKQVFVCIKDAVDWCGQGGVGACCRGKTKTSGGYHWQFLDDYKRQLRMNTDINNSRLAA